MLCVGYQARGTLGRTIAKYGMRDNGYVDIDDKRYEIGAQIHQLSGYSAHADRHDLLRFVRRMRRKPSLIKMVHGDDHAKVALRDALLAIVPDCEVVIAT